MPSQDTTVPDSKALPTSASTRTHVRQDCSSYQAIGTFRRRIVGIIAMVAMIMTLGGQMAGASAKPRSPEVMRGMLNSPLSLTVADASVPVSPIPTDQANQTNTVTQRDIEKEEADLAKFQPLCDSRDIPKSKCDAIQQHIEDMKNITHNFDSVT